VNASYTYTWRLVRQFQGLTVLENAVRPAIDSAHRPVGEPVGHQSTANQMSGLQATHRTSASQQSALKSTVLTVLHCNPASFTDTRLGVDLKVIEKI
jgi:hypothetical protein